MLRNPTLVAVALTSVAALAACGTAVSQVSRPPGVTRSALSLGAAPAPQSGTDKLSQDSATATSGGIGFGAPSKSAAAAPPPPVQTTAADQIPAGLRVERDANLTLQVGHGSFDSSLDRIFALVTALGGYVSGSDAQAQPDQPLRTGSITFKIPVTRFQDAVTQLKQIGSMRSLSIGGPDFTSEYVDLQGRLKAAQAQRDSMLALLHQATSISDIIAIQNQLGQVEQTIEVIQGRLDFIDHSTTYSTFTVDLRESGATVTPPAHDTWGFLTALGQSLHGFVAGVDAMILAIGIALPYLLVIGGALYFTRRRWVPVLVRAPR